MTEPKTPEAKGKKKAGKKGGFQWWYVPAGGAAAYISYYLYQKYKANQATAATTAAATPAAATTALPTTSTVDPTSGGSDSTTTAGSLDQWEQDAVNYLTSTAGGSLSPTDALNATISWVNGEPIDSTAAATGLSGFLTNGGGLTSLPSGLNINPITVVTPAANGGTTPTYVDPNTSITPTTAPPNPNPSLGASITSVENFFSPNNTYPTGMGPNGPVTSSTPAAATTASTKSSTPAAAITPPVVKTPTSTKSSSQVKSANKTVVGYSRPGAAPTGGVTIPPPDIKSRGGA